MNNLDNTYKQHWENVFATKSENKVSWFQPYPKTSMDFIELFNLPIDANIIDIGGGDSHFVDALLDKGYKNIYVLDMLLVIVSAFYAPGLLFISACIAFVALVADTIITVKGNLPINTEINSWTNERFPHDWEKYRIQWLTFYQYRQILNITGFVCLVAGVVFG